MNEPTRDAHRQSPNKPTCFDHFKWQIIVNNFSILEYEIIEEERNAADSPPSSNLKSMSPTSVTSDSAGSTASNNTSVNLYSCVIDRNRMIKYGQPFASWSSTAGRASALQLSSPSPSLSGAQNSKLKMSPISSAQSASIIANVNVFYELLQSMPELSRLNIK